MALKTAVDWLVKELGIVDDSLLFPKVEQAKQMFQQQIEAAYKNGDGEHDKVADKLAKQYYTKTYNNETR
jgi:hypothetical protein